ncbi:MAG: prepilin-type N-terminal cleavage/methylation domain-containing protein [Candidatus Omnitrophota bacterium]
MRFTKSFFKDRSLTGFTPLEYTPCQKSVSTKKNIHNIIVGKKCLFKDRSLTGFSLLELLIGFVIMTVVLLAGASLSHDLIDANRYKKTMTEMEKVAHAMVGEPEEVQTGHQAGFGYFGLHHGWPAGDDRDGVALVMYELTAEPKGITEAGIHDFLMDEWGKEYRFRWNEFGSDYERKIESYGSDGYYSIPPTGSLTDGGGADRFEQNITYLMDTSTYAYTRNKIAIFIKDANGTLLRLNHAAETAYYFHQIYRVDITTFGSNAHYYFVSNAGGGAAGGPAGTDITYDSGAVRVINLPAGFYLVSVVPTPKGSAQQGEFCHQDDLAGLDDLAGNGETYIQKVITVYPRGLNVTQCFEVRLPGVLSPDETGSYDVILN